MAPPLTIDDLVARLDDWGKRLESIENNQKELTKKLDTNQHDLRATINHHGEKLKRLSAAITRLDPNDGLVLTESNGFVQSSAPHPQPPLPQQLESRPPSTEQYFHPRPKLEFPTYDGREDPLPWLNRCESFFRGQHNPEDRRIWYASIHMTGPAQLWYLRLELNSGEPPWRSFVRLVQNRFGPPMTDTLLGALKLLQRTTSVEDYCEKFMSLACRDAELSESQQVQLFIAGLRNPLQLDVALQRPYTLNEAITLARAYEQRMLLSDPLPIRSAPRQSFRSLPSTASSAQPGVASSKPGASTATVADPSALSTSSSLGCRRLSPSEMAQRRAAGLCYNCDEKFVYGHKCKRLFILEVVPDEEDAAEDEAPEQDNSTSDAPAISLHALTGIRSNTYHTMRMWVNVGNVRLQALLDSGSTHNFMDSAVAAKLQLPSKRPTAMRVTVGNGDRVACSSPITDIDMVVGWTSFKVDCYVMDIGGYDLVLGVSFLGTLGPLLWYFAEQTLCFQSGDRRILWAGIDWVPPPSLHAITQSGDSMLESLLERFTALFQEPAGLPPQRAINLRIRLQPGIDAVAVRPYRYAHIQKDELERQCAEMLHQGVFRASSSAFSSPALLVRKQDGSWRLCVDYRALNAKTVKDKFPILVVEELLDELRGAKHFTKLDLHSGYHQVLMLADDIHNTAFRTHQGLFEFLVMPFGLTNAPATFQALMNQILQRFLRRFVLFFFYDILIYSSSWAEYLQYIHFVLQTLADHSLFLKRSKCSFAASSVAYLGHVISAAGMAMDEDKIRAVLSWPVPRTVRAVRGFLGLAGYYRRFIRGYGATAAPLTKLLCKEGFRWTSEAETAFVNLRKALTQAPVLQLPDFQRPFIVECDASGSGFGAVLHQGEGAVAFFSRPIAPRHVKLAAYEWELIGLVQAVRHWRPYLWGRPFIVKTDHRSLKFLLDQRLSTIPQHPWASKLIGFDFMVEFKPGHANVVADALSRRNADDEQHLGACAAVSGPVFTMFEELRAELAQTPQLDSVRGHAEAGTEGWSTLDGLILKNKRVFVPAGSPLVSKIIADAHTAGHEGVQKTLHRVCATFHIPGDHGLVRQYVSSCRVCQQNKTDHLRPAGLLQSLEVPLAVWADIAMDFMEGLCGGTADLIRAKLPRVNGKTVILTVVDRFSKFAHFIPLAHPYTATTVARAFFSEIVRLHGIPASIVSDRDPVFTSTFWRELFELSGTKLNMSSAFHPQSDGQSKATNKIITMYLRCLTGDRPRQWIQWLPWAEFCYNSSFQASLGTSPFKVVYGRDPPTLQQYNGSSARLPAVDQQLRDRDEFLMEIRDRSEQAQQYQKNQHDRRHREVVFSPGQWVWLRLLHRPAASLDVRGRSKLGPRFYGPFKVLERIGEVAYRLLLPAGARLHNVFHVGLLKPYKGEEPQETPELPPIQHGRVLRGRLARGMSEVLVQWQGQSAAEAAWVPLAEFKQRYPSFQLEDELIVQAGRDVMHGRQYRRRHRRNNSSKLGS
ncbi:hypothetical protein U9M48_042006 [Paspalum notatum var. saurae]|uniref:Reverse transcriptase n=1 Tax=Paspalum notatum var. saurae TaxID=547442 RepID=A0AAQ3UVZ6_PASNO